MTVEKRDLLVHFIFDRELDAGVDGVETREVICDDFSAFGASDAKYG